jgi:predicted DNA-binding transcriptional regulator AlpA
MFENDPTFLVRVLNRTETLKALGVSDRTFDRIEAAGEGPPRTRLSANRIGYRVSDLQRWLDCRREAAA